MALVLAALCGLVFSAGVTCAALAVTGGLPRLRRRAPRMVLGVGLRRVVWALVAAGSVGWLTGWPVAAGAAAAAVWWLPRLLASSEPKHSIAMTAALATWVRRVGDLLASGAGGLEHALVRSAEAAPPVLAEPVGRLCHRVRRDGPETALRAFADEVAAPDADEVVLALLLRLRTGGRGLAEILHAQATALSARAAARREVEADRAKPRTTARTLVGITASMTAALLLFASDYLAAFDSLTGQGVLALVVAVFAAALWWMHRLAATPPGPRYLAASGGGLR